MPAGGGWGGVKVGGRGVGVIQPRTPYEQQINCSRARWLERNINFISRPVVFINLLCRSSVFGGAGRRGGERGGRPG